MKKRNVYEIVCEREEDGSEFDLVCFKNGEVIKEKEFYSLGDMCLGLYDFERSVYDEEKVDVMVDEFKIEVEVSL